MGSSRSDTSIGGETFWAKWRLTVSVFFLDGASLDDGFVTFPFGSVVCPRAVAFAVRGFLAGFLAGASVAAASVTVFPAASREVNCSAFFFRVAPADFCFALAVPSRFAPSPIGSGKSSAGTGSRTAEAALRDGCPSTVWIASNESIREACQMLAALVNDAGASSGTGAALLPLRKGGFLVAFERRSQIEGNSGDDEMTTTECRCAILAGEEAKVAAVAILDLSSRETPTRPARRTRAQKLVGDGSLGNKRGTGAFGIRDGLGRRIVVWRLADWPGCTVVSSGGGHPARQQTLERRDAGKWVAPSREHLAASADWQPGTQPHNSSGWSLPTPCTGPTHSTHQISKTESKFETALKFRSPALRHRNALPNPSSAALATSRKDGERPW